MSDVTKHREKNTTATFLCAVSEKYLYVMEPLGDCLLITAPKDSTLMLIYINTFLYFNL